MSTHAPLRLPRLAALFMSFAFGVVGLGVGINALVKYQDQKHDLQRFARANSANLYIDASDIISTGIVTTVSIGLIAIVSLLFAIPLTLAPSLAARGLALQTAVLGFLSVWCFAVLVPFTDFFANRSAKISAFIGTFPVPQTLINTLQSQVGATPVYHKIHYLRLPAVIWWFSFLFAVISTVVTFMAYRRARNSPYSVHAHAHANDSTSTDREVSEKSKLPQQDA